MNIFKAGDALLIVDPQNDFFPGGALPVPEGDQIISVLNEWISKAQKADIPILISRDWHPINHCSFKEYGGIWPSHCIQDTKGADFHAHLKFPENVHIINKAFTPESEAYSAFGGGHLESFLESHHIHRLWVGGLALDYCVKATVLDAVEAGYEVHLILDATRAIAKNTETQAMNLMKEKGVHFLYVERKEIRWKQRFSNYKRAFEFLKQGLGIPHPTPIEIAGITQAFEFTFELAWKTLKDFLIAKGEDVNFPRDVLKKAFEHSLIDEGDVWMDMLEKRNLMSHTYEETKANLAYQLIKEEYFKPLNSFYEYFLKIGNE